MACSLEALLTTKALSGDFALLISAYLWCGVWREEFVTVPEVLDGLPRALHPHPNPPTNSGHQNPDSITLLSSVPSPFFLALCLLTPHHTLQGPPTLSSSALLSSAGLVITSSGGQGHNPQDYIRSL